MHLYNFHLKHLKPLRHVSIFSDHHQGVSSFPAIVITLLGTKLWKCNTLLHYYELNRENVISLARNDETPWWWSEKIETCRSGFKCFKRKLYRCICWLIVEVMFCLVFTRVLHWILSRIKEVYSTSLHHAYSKVDLILSSRSIAIWFLAFRFFTKIFINFFFNFRRLLLCFSLLVRLDDVTLIKYGERCELWITFVRSSFSLLPYPFPLFRILLSAPCFQARAVYCSLLWVKDQLSYQCKTGHKVNSVCK